MKITEYAIASRFAKLIRDFEANRPLTEEELRELEILAPIVARYQARQEKKGVTA